MPVQNNQTISQSVRQRAAAPPPPQSLALGPRVSAIFCVASCLFTRPSQPKLHHASTLGAPCRAMREKPLVQHSAELTVRDAASIWAHGGLQHCAACGHGRWAPLFLRISVSPCPSSKPFCSPSPSPLDLPGSTQCDCYLPRVKSSSAKHCGGLSWMWSHGNALTTGAMREREKEEAERQFERAASFDPLRETLSLSPLFFFLQQLFPPHRSPCVLSRSHTPTSTHLLTYSLFALSPTLSPLTLATCK